MIKNAWYVAAHSSELAPGQVLARAILGESMVLYRNRGGQACALLDRCPHRLLPLSLGTVVEAGLQCGYHGATFNGNGECVRIAGQDEVPRAARVRSFPVRERFGLVWVWPGDPARADDESSIPAFLGYGIAPYDTADGQILSFAADYRLLVDNLLDAAHASFVHPTTFGAPLWLLSAKSGEAGAMEPEQRFEFDARPRGLWYHYAARDTVPGPAFVQAYARKLGLERFEGRLDIDLDVEWCAPATFIFSSVTRAPGAGEAQGIGLINLHMLTPETEYTTHYFYRNAYRFHPHDPDFKAFWHDAAGRAFAEDRTVIEAQQRAIGARDLFDHDLVSFGTDRLAIQGRRLLERLAREEHAT